MFLHKQIALQAASDPLAGIETTIKTVYHLGGDFSHLFAIRNVNANEKLASVNFVVKTVAMQRLSCRGQITQSLFFLLQLKILSVISKLSRNISSYQRC